MTMLLLTSGAVVLLTCASYLGYELVTFRRTSVQQLDTLGEIIASNSTAALAFDAPDDAQQILSALAADRQIVAAVLYRADGTVFARFPADLSASDYPLHPGPSGHNFEHNGLAAFHTVTRDGKPLGTLYLRTSGNALFERLRLFGGFFVVVIAAAGALVFVLSRSLQRQISGPILALAGTARAMAESQDYAGRATKLGNDEIGVLTDAFNAMVGRLANANHDLELRVRDRTAALEEANHELEAFSYSVSHDLRAPLRHIGGFATMLRQHTEPVLDEKGRRFITVIQQSTARMAQLIDDLLAFSKHGRAELQHEPVDLADLIEQIKIGFQGELDDRHVEWNVAPLPTVRGDTSLLRQVFTNLLGNAVKYTRRQPIARIEIGTVTPPNGEAVVFVRDNGAGFDMQYVDKLFGVFQRLHHDTEFEGTGVGLATVRRIVQRHGGRVWAEGEPGVGAVFYVALPTNAPTTAPLS